MLGFVFLVLDFNGFVIGESHDDLFLYLGLGILLLVTLPLHFLERYNYNKRKESIIKTYKTKKGPKKVTGNNKGSKVNYPSFRKQKSGLTWGGGNIHGSSAKRGAKRGFLKH